LFGKLVPELMRQSAIPDLPEKEKGEWIFLVPLILSGMMLWRLAPRGKWIARWPLAFFIGATAGIRLVAYLQADFVAQISNTILPLLVMQGGGFDVWASLRHIVIVCGI